MKTIFPIIVLMFSTQALANDHYWPPEHHTPHQHKMYHEMHVKPHHEHKHHYKNHSSSHLHGDAGTSQQHLPD
jgi:hypothetical protein